MTKRRGKVLTEFWETEVNFLLGMERVRQTAVEFGSFRVDLENRLLLKHGEAVALAPKTFELLALDPDQVVARRALIELSDTMARYQAGLVHARRVLKIAPRDPQALLAAGRAYFRVGMTDRAIALLQEALGLDVGCTECRTELAFVFLYTGQFSKVINLFASASVTNTDKRALMAAYSKSGNCAEALATARKYQPQAGHPSGWLARGITLKACGREEEARQAWTEGALQAEAELKLEDQHHKRLALALLYARLGRSAAAHENTRHALALSPGHPWILFFAGEMEALLENRRAALNYLRQAVDRDWLQPHYFDYYSGAKHGFHSLKDDPEYLSLRNEVRRKVDELTNLR